jgi:hypothetical protein
VQTVRGKRATEQFVESGHITAMQQASVDVGRRLDAASGEKLQD